MMAHSPPAGSAGGEVVHVTKETDWENAAGKIVLVGRDWGGEAYRRANEAGATGFIAYRGGTGDAIPPYIGLFLSRDDLEWAKIPAVAVPENLAARIIEKLNSGGERVTANIEVEVQINERQVLPILYAEIGREPFILFTAHVCHPKPGANDNASGSAMLIELARVLQGGVYDDSFRFGFAFLWIPEYYGTQAFVEKYAQLERYYAVINLDMVAGSEDRAGSTIMLVRTPPLSRFSIVSGLLEYFLELANGSGNDLAGNPPLPRLKFRAYPPYEMGERPRRLQLLRRSCGDADNLARPFLPLQRGHGREGEQDEHRGHRKGRSGHRSGPREGGAGGTRALRPRYAMKYLGELSMERGGSERAERLVMMGLARDSRFLGIERGYPFEGRPWIRWVKKGRVSGELVRSIDEEAYREFKALTRDRRTLVHLHELLMLGELLPEEEAMEALREEFGGEVEEEKLKKILSLLEKTGSWRGFSSWTCS